MTYSLELDFVDRGEPSRPSKAIARIFIKCCGGREDEASKGLSYITQDCVSLQEFNSEIDRLQKELEELRNKAKKKFAR